MTTSFGRRPLSKADDLHRKTRTTYFVEDPLDGTPVEVVDRKPQGKRVSRFVDMDGNVVSVQLAADGDVQPHATEDRIRQAQHKKGFVEHARCPLRHGVRTKHVVEDLAKCGDLPPECKADPKVMSRRDGDLYAGQACPHIEALIKFRRQRAAEAYRKRNPGVIAGEKRAAEKAELERLQIETLSDQLSERRRKPKARTDRTES